ncbi:hypothetical protein [Brevibacterium album]|uniref:hypothetical protein n=1 Tax=Brevibacterium album TaxID=417948 RepID=UPI0003F69002|nr:hypothetical protein [Brevibacterium album]
MNRKTALRPTALAAVLGTSLVLAACGGGEEATDAAEDTGQVQEDAAEAEEVAAEEDAEEEAAPAGEGGVPAWAKEPTEGGEQIASVEAGDVAVDVFQMGTASAPKDGNWVDPDTDEPIIAEGDDIVFVNYVITNNGDPIDLGSSLVSVSAEYDDWEYMQGMGGITDNALSEEMGVQSSGVAETADPTVYTFGTGEHFSYGENFHYQPGSDISFEVTITPVDAEGELLHDDKIEGEGSGTIE